MDLSVLGRLRGRSELRRGALRAHGVDEGAIKAEPEEKKEAGKKPLSNLLHSKGHLDGETVKRISGEAEYPVYNDDKRAKKEMLSPVKEEPAAPRKIRADLSPTQLAVLAAMPEGVAVGLDRICESGIDASTAMMTLTMLEISGLVETLPGNRYLKK